MSVLAACASALVVRQIPDHPLVSHCDEAFFMLTILDSITALTPYLGPYTHRIHRPTPVIHVSSKFCQISSFRLDRLAQSTRKSLLGLLTRTVVAVNCKPSSMVLVRSALCTRRCPTRRLPSSAVQSQPQLRIHSDFSTVYIERSVGKWL